MATRKLHPIGKRFQRLTSTVSVSDAQGTVTSTRKRVKIYFVVADEAHKFMCRYYWEEGDLGGPFNDAYQMQVLAANADETAPTSIKNEVIGTEGGGLVPLELDRFSTVDIEGVASIGRTRASCGIITASADVFTVYFTDVEVDGPSPRFRLRFRGSPPADLVHLGLRGDMFRVGPKQKFGLDNSWIPRF